MGNNVIPTWVRGNDVAVALPLESRVVSDGGAVVEDYRPGAGDSVEVVLAAFRRYRYVPEVDGNVLRFTVGGDVACGLYRVEVRIVTASGARLRSCKLRQLRIVESNDELPAGSQGTDEFTLSGVELEAGAYIFAKGKDGDPIGDVDYEMDAETMCLELEYSGGEPSPTPTPTPVKVTGGNQTWRNVRHCIRYNSKAGFVYTGKKMVYIADLPNGCMMMPCMIFPKNEERTFDLSKLGTKWFNHYGSYDGHEQEYTYTIDDEAQTITFRDDTPNGRVAWLLFPDRKGVTHDVTPYSTKCSDLSIGYYINRDGELCCTHEYDGEKLVRRFAEPILDPPLEPIYNSCEFDTYIDFRRPPVNYKNLPSMNANIVDRQEGEMQEYHQGWFAINVSRKSFELQVLKGDQYRAYNNDGIYKWVKIRPAYLLKPKGCGGTEDKKTDGWNLVSCPRSCVILIRVRRTNYWHTRFSDWSYWKVYLGHDRDGNDKVTRIFIEKVRKCNGLTPKSEVHY